jgi:hypothetical protein
MNYSDSFRSGPSRRYSRQDDESYEIRRSINYSAAPDNVDYDGVRDSPGPSSAAPRRRENAIPIPGPPPPPPPPPPDIAYVPDRRGPSRRPPRGGELEYGDGDPGPSLRRSTHSDTPLSYHERLERREREEPVEYMEIPRVRRDAPPRREEAYGDPGPSSRPRSPSPVEERAELVLENARARREVPLRRQPPIERYIEIPHYDRREHRERPRPRPHVLRPVIYNGHDGRRIPPGGRPISPPHERLRPRPRPVPPGFVQPAPPLMHPDKVPGHDLASLAQRPSPNAGEDIRNNLVLCVYRNSKKSFDYRFVELMETGHRLDRRFKSITDRQLFRSMRSKYQNELRGWVRRFLSFKALSTVRLLQVGNGYPNL